MKALLQIIVGSSSKASRKSSLVHARVAGRVIDVPFVQTKKQMKKHNGFILSEVSSLAAFSNAGRVIHDRVGRSRSELNQFLESYEFKLVSDELLRGYNGPEAEAAGIKLVNKLLNTKNENGELLHYKIIDYISSLKYSELRFIEKTISNLLVILSHVGSPYNYFHDGKKLSEEDKYYQRRYGKNNFFSFFKAMDKIISLWPKIEKYLPSRINGKDFNFIEFLRPVNNLLVFFKKSLLEESLPSKNIIYKLINESFLMFDEVLFYKNDQHQEGMTYVTEMAKQDSVNAKIQNTIKSIYTYFTQLHKRRSGNSFIEFGENLKTITNNKLISLAPYRDYIFHTTRRENCLKDSKKCLDNIHYDEPAKLISLALSPHPKKSGTHFEIGMKNILIEDRESIMKMINDIMPYLEIKPVVNP